MINMKGRSSRSNSGSSVEVENASLLRTSQSETSAPYQEVFKATGFGRWHILLLAQCGWANASDAIEIMCISFTMESVTSAMHIQPSDVTWLTVVLFLGMMFGGYIWGSLADIWGRRQVIMFSLAVNGLFGVASAFAETYWLLLLLRFFSGFGAGGSLPVCFSYFSEFQPRQKRGAMISALATSWMAGNIIAAGLAWLIIPSSDLVNISPSAQTWRLFVIFCAIPSLSSSLFFYLMPESPKFLMQKGKTEEAFEVLKTIFHRNYPNQTFQYTGISDGVKGELSVDSHIPSPAYRFRIRRWRSLCIGVCNFFLSIGKVVKYQFKTVFCSNPKTSKDSAVLMTVNFAIAFGGYGMYMWLPSLMEKMERNAGSPCAVVNNSIPINSSDTKMYVDVFIGAAAQLPANIITILIMDRVGSKIIICVSLLVSGLSVLFIYLVKSKLQVILLSAVFNCFSSMTYNGLDVITPEMYDTSTRAMATGLITALSRIASILGNVVFGAFINTNCNIPLLTVTSALLLGGIVSILLPNTRQIELR